MKVRDVIKHDFIVLQADLDVKTAMKKVVSMTQDDTLIDYLYIIDDKKRLIGVLELKSLIIARAQQKLSEVMSKHLKVIHDHIDVSEAIDIIQNYDKTMMPVVNHKGEIIGIFSAEDALDLLADETQEDYQMMASLTAYDIKSKPFERSKQRLPWLIVLLMLSITTATVLALFEQTIQTIILLVLFQPMILDAAGNVSTQSLAKTLIMLNDDEIALKPFIRKEITTGFINALFISLAGFGLSYLYLILFQPQSTIIFNTSLTVSLALLFALIVGAITGAFVPLTLKRFKIDPSVASGPFMTTLNDVISLLIYFTLATILII